MSAPKLTDDDILEMIKLRCEGCDSSDIAAYFGISAPYARKVMNSVKNDDINQAAKPENLNEDECQVAACYWTSSGMTSFAAEILV